MLLGLILSPFLYRVICDHLQFVMLKLHNKYGDIVRISLNELGFVSLPAWPDMQDHKTGGSKHEFANQTRFTNL